MQQCQLFFTSIYDNITSDKYRKELSKSSERNVQNDICNLSGHATQLPHWIGKTFDTLVEHRRQHCGQSRQFDFIEPVRHFRFTAHTTLHRYTALGMDCAPLLQCSLPPAVGR